MPSQTDLVTKPQIRKYRMTVRTRFALTYCSLLTGSGAVMLTLLYIFMRFVPTYDFLPSNSVPAQTIETTLMPTEPEAIPPGAETGTAAEITQPASEILISSTDQLFNVLLSVSIVVLFVLAIVGIGVGWVAAGRMLKPLQYINEAVSQATRGDLSHRTTLAGPTRTPGV